MERFDWQNRAGVETPTGRDRDNYPVAIGGQRWQYPLRRSLDGTNRGQTLASQRHAPPGDDN